MFHDPVATHVGLALITHQLGYFDILPLYVVLMLMAPVIAVVDRYAPQAVLPLSLLVYVVTLAFQISIPTWPVEGQWFFNPLAWQLVFVLGFVMAREDGVGGFVRRHIVAIRWIALPIVVAALAMRADRLVARSDQVPQPRLFFLIDKTFETPPRLIQFLALIAVMSATYPYILKASQGLVNFLSMLGRNSLYVFCVGSILSLAGQIIRYIYQGNFVIDTAVVIFGVAIMAFTAWLPEWREEVRGRRRRRSGAVVLTVSAVCAMILGARAWAQSNVVAAGVAADAGAVFAGLPGRHDGDGERFAAAQRRGGAGQAQADQDSGDRRVGLGRPRRACTAATPARPGKFSGRPSRASTSS